MPDDDPNFMPAARAPMPLGLAADLQDSLLVASNDLERLQRLLSEASEALMWHFNGASVEVNSLARMAAQHPDINCDGLHGALQHLGGAITAMQFQDMASQLITHTLGHLRACSDIIARDVMGDDDDATAVISTAPTRPNPVTQDEMHAGSIELF